MAQPYMNDPSFWTSWTGPLLLIIETLLLILVIVVGFFYFRRRKKTPPSEPPLIPESDQSLQEIVDSSQETSQTGQKMVYLGGESYSVDKELNISQPIYLKGEGVNKTKIVATGEQPAIKIDNAKNCYITNMRVEGAIQCSKGELQVENCHIVANTEGVCIEALEGSSVVFSGMISGGSGGIAIRARGESQVVLKPPYKVGGEDFVIMDPKSKITLEEEQQKKPEKEE